MNVENVATLRRLKKVNRERNKPLHERPPHDLAAHLEDVEGLFFGETPSSAIGEEE